MKSLANISKEVNKTILKAGNMILKGSRSKNSIHTKSTESDLVTQLDLKIENFLKEKLSRILPDSNFLAEETESEFKETGKLWIIDPIDGTTNFIHNFPFYAISVALQLDGEIVLGFVFNPSMNEFYEAKKGAGSTLNGKGIRVSPTQTLSKSLLATGFAYNFNTADENNIRYFEHFLSLSRGIRRPGSAALDLCYVARGSFDGFWEWYLNPWDVAAGILIAQEAGGKVTDLFGEPYKLINDNIVVTNSSIHHEMITEIKKISRT